VAVNINLSDLKKQIKIDVENIQREQEEAFKKAAEDTIESIFNGAIVNVLLRLQSGNHPHTNEILKSMYFKQVSYSSNNSGASSIWEIGNTFQWAEALEMGTRAHDIIAKPGKPLVFETEEYQPWNNWARNDKDPVIGRDGGYLKVTDKVKHPGAKPTRFLSDSIIDNFKQFDKFFDKHLNQISL
jgi:hypothetical protein